MQNLILSFEIILPVCLLMALGQFLKGIRFLDDSSLKTMNRMVFRVFLPVMLYYNIYQTDIRSAFDKTAVLFTVAAILTAFFVLCFLVPLFVKEKAKSGVLIQGIFRSNFVIFGLPVVMSMYPDADWGFTSILIAVAVPMFNVLSVIILEISRGSKVECKKIMRGIFTNPLVIASILGILTVLLKLHFPTPIEKTMGDLAKVTTPLALIVLGGSMDFHKVKQNLGLLAAGIIGKLAILPLAFIPCAVLLGYRGITLATFLTMFASPTAVSSFTMAQQMDGDADLAAELVVFTSVFSVITMFLWIFILKQMHLL